MKRVNMVAMSGFILCFAAIIFGIATNGGIGTIRNFLHYPSLLVTLGGSLFAVLTTADSFDDYLDGMKSFFYAFQKPDITTEYVSERILELANVARKEGLLSLEENVQKSENEFLQKGIRLIVDGSAPQMVKDVLESEVLHKEERNLRRIKFWQELGAYGPAWGMVGMLLGLINMMRSMGDGVSTIGAGMSLALITTLYGSIIANWIRLRKRSI